MKLHRMVSLKTSLAKKLFYAASQKNGITNKKLLIPNAQCPMPPDFGFAIYDCRLKLPINPKSKI
jgi:hypothetical protein